MNIVYATFLGYYSSLDRYPFYLGTLLHNVITGEKSFIINERLNEIIEYDSDINADFVKVYVEGIKNDWEHSGNRSVEDYIQFFANNFRFSKIIKCYEEIEI